MKEQSHKDEMSAAIRGDFERLRARGVPVALAPQEPAEPAFEPEPPLDEPVLEPKVSPLPEPVPVPAVTPGRTGWLARLTGRSP